MTRKFLLSTVLFGWIAGMTPVNAQTGVELITYFKQYSNLTPAQIATIGRGEPVTKILDSRVASEIFVLGVVHIKADPESYVKFATDFARLGKSPVSQVGKISDPPARRSQGLRRVGHQGPEAVNPPPVTFSFHAYHRRISQDPQLLLRISLRVNRSLGRSWCNPPELPETG
jgi:hypothetical protein